MQPFLGFSFLPSLKLARAESTQSFRPRPGLAIVALAALLVGITFGSGLLGAAPTAEAASPSVQPILGTESLLSIACPTPSLCFAVGDNLSASPAEHLVVPLAIQGSSVAVGPIQMISVSFDLTLRGIACPSSTMCLAVGAGDATTQGVVLPLQIRGTSVSAALPVTVPEGNDEGDLDSVACPTSTTCFAVGSSSSILNSQVVQQGDVVSLVVSSTGVTVETVQTVDGPGRLRGIACPSTTLCVATGVTPDNGGASATQGAVVPFAISPSGVTVGTAQTLSTVANLYNVACQTSVSCLVAGTNATQGAIVPLSLANGGVSIGTIQTISAPSGIEGIACPTSTACLATGGNSVEGIAAPVSQGGSAINLGPIQAVAGASDLTSVACPTNTACLGVGSSVSASLSPGPGVVALLTMPAPAGTTNLASGG